MTSKQPSIEIQNSSATVFRGVMPAEEGLRVHKIEGTDLKVAWYEKTGTRNFLPSMLRQWERDVPEQGTVTTAALTRAERHTVHKWAADHNFAHRTLRILSEGSLDDMYKMRLAAL